MENRYEYKLLSLSDIICCAQQIKCCFCTNPEEGCRTGDLSFASISKQEYRKAQLENQIDAELIAY